MSQRNGGGFWRTGWMLGMAMGGIGVGAWGATPAPGAEPGGSRGISAGEFRWQSSGALIAAAVRGEDPCYSVKDPSVVWHEGRWHVFCTIRSRKRTHQIEYLTLADWAKAGEASRQVLKMHDGFFCAPQVFFFRPHGRWYLVCQASDPAWTPNYQAAYATTTNLADAASWSRLTPLGARPAEGKAGLDFWVVCDEVKAHLFFTTNDGRMWREETSLAEFPRGWSAPVLAIQGDIFEASHTYRLRDRGKYLTLVEAQGGKGWRYHKAYLADRLEGPWSPLAADRDKAFASLGNVEWTAGRWSDSISHGELLRVGSDERLEVESANLRFVFQGVSDAERAGKAYGEIPWRLGMLEEVGTSQPRDAAGGK